MKVDNVKIAAGQVERVAIAVSSKKLEARKRPADPTPTHTPQEDPGVEEVLPNGWR
jgi:hypothetical protein